MQKFWKQIIFILVTRLNTSRTPFFVRGMTEFFSFFLLSHPQGRAEAATKFINQMNEIQPNLFSMVFGGVLLKEIHLFIGSPDRRKVIAAFSSLLMDTPLFQQSTDFLPLW